MDQVNIVSEIIFHKPDNNTYNCIELIKWKYLTINTKGLADSVLVIPPCNTNQVSMYHLCGVYQVPYKHQFVLYGTDTTPNWIYLRFGQPLVNWSFCEYEVVPEPRVSLNLWAICLEIANSNSPTILFTGVYPKLFMLCSIFLQRIPYVIKRIVHSPIADFICFELCFDGSLLSPCSKQSKETLKQIPFFDKFYRPKLTSQIVKRQLSWLEVSNHASLYHQHIMTVLHITPKHKPIGLFTQSVHIQVLQHLKFQTMS